MNVRYITSQGDGSGIFGFYGYGATLEGAKAALKKAAKRKGKGPITVNKFTSELPFAPSDRKATKGECDAWVGRDGSLNWERCNRELLEGGTHE